MLIGEFLQQHMDAKNMTVAELSRQSGIAPSTIRSIIIRNNERVAIESLLKICTAIGCDINEYIDTLRDPSDTQDSQQKADAKKPAENVIEKSPRKFSSYEDAVKYYQNEFSEEEFRELEMFAEFLRFRRGGQP